MNEVMHIMILLTGTEIVRNRMKHVSPASVLVFWICLLVPALSCFAADINLAWDANAEADLAGYRVYVGTASGTYGSPVDIGNVTAYTVTGLGPGTYYFAVTAYNASGLESGFSNEVFATIDSSDTTSPALSITSPTSSSTYSTSSSSLNMSGTASDNIAVTQVTWVNNRGGSGTASGTTSWSVTGIVLSSGSNVITVTARDAAGNSSTATLTVTYTPPDTTVPTISITSPTSGSTYSTSSSSLNMSGTASDNIAVTQVTWVNNRGGSGTASGTSSWSIAGITLSSGSNVITVTARDAAGNSSTATLTVTYTPSDTTLPTIGITSPTSGSTYSTSSSPLNMSGTASDNIAVTQVTWVNNRGGSGTASGTSSWSVTGIALSSGSNVITVTARDAAGNTRTATLTITYTPSDTTAPAISIASPTSGSTYSTSSSSLNMSGTASDNIAVTQVTWANDRGGSGTASGTTSWSVTGITLSSGSNVITVTARDAAGNTGADTLTVTYTPSDTTPPVISNMSASGIDSSSAVISWTTNEASDSQVEYGTSTAYGSSTTLNAGMLTSHSQTLSGLTQGTLHHYRVKSRDAAGNLAASGDSTFTTNNACSYAINPSSVSVSAIASQGNLAVIAPSGCAWSATSNAGWISIASGSSGSGNGNLSYSIAANSTQNSRAGSLTVAGLTFAITQLKTGYDINGDGTVNVLDLQILANVILGVASCPGNCDINGDASVNALDLQILVNVILGVQTPLAY
jgi:hypothetical protein